MRWIEASALKKGDNVMNGHGDFVPIFELEVLEGPFDVFDLTTANPCHNYVANGLLCHNKQKV